MSDEVLTGGRENPGEVVRVGDTVRRPRGSGRLVTEALLVYLESVGFDEAPKFLGVDDDGRQILSYVDGTATDPVPWQHDDERNAAQLGTVAATLARLHAATAGFTPPPVAKPRRPLAVPGTTWTHGDVGYSNIVFVDERLAGLIDWEFAAPGHPHNDLAALLAMSVRGPKLGAPDNPRRERAVATALRSIADGYGMDQAAAASLPALAAVVIEDAISHWRVAAPGEPFDAWRWRADWFGQLSV